MNSVRARVLRGLSVNGEAVPDELVMRSASLKLRDLMADKPGRSFAPKGGDPLAEDQRDFVRQVISLLDSHRLAGDFEVLAVFADSDVLGLLRQLMPPLLKETIIREVPKNLLHPSPHDFQRVIARELDDDRFFS